MGRKKRTEAAGPAGPRDRIGDPVDFDECPECPEHTDCFACLEGKCTALKESGGADCVFYKPADTVVRESKQIYMDLRRKGRSDLIREHAETFAALGAFDDEIWKAESTAADLESFRIDDYKNALAEMEQKEEEQNHRREDTDGEGTNGICQSAVG